MNEDSIKGSLQKVGGRVEEAAGALTGDHDLKDAGREDQVKGSVQEAWGNVKDAGKALVDRVKEGKHEAEAGTASANAYDREHTAGVDKDTI